MATFPATAPEKEQATGSKEDIITKYAKKLAEEAASILNLFLAEGNLRGSLIPTAAAPLIATALEDALLRLQPTLQRVGILTNKGTLGKLKKEAARLFANILQDSEKRRDFPNVARHIDILKPRLAEAEEDYSLLWMEGAAPPQFPPISRDFKIFRKV